MRLVPYVLALPIALSSAALAVDTTLPIQRVVLYKHGVGYFERQGTVNGNTNATLRFKQNEMGDVLKSLTVLDKSGGRVSSIAYDSQKPANEILAEFAFDLRKNDIQLEMLKQLRGARVAVDVAGRGRITGAVLGVDERLHAEVKAVRKVPILSLFADSGEVVSVDLFDLTSLEFTDPALASDLQRYLSTLRSAQRRDEKNVQLECEGTGDRSIFASYAIEQPVWKATYRLVLLDDGKKPLLQGWAIVDNTSDEDWTDVDLSLIAGLPVSFRHDLYTPRHVERPFLQIKEQAVAALGTTGFLTGASKEKGAMAGGAMAAGKKLRFAGRGGGGPGSGKDDDAGLAKPGLATLAEPTSPAPMGFEEAFDAQRAESVTREIGDLLEYEIDHKVSIPRNRSALLPIVKSDVEGERVALYRESARAGNPLSAIRMKNTSGLALEAGPFTVLEGSTYAGEAYVDSLKPLELRYIPFAVELGIKAESKLESRRERVRRVEIKQGVMRSRYDLRDSKVYTFTSHEKEPRRVIIEHPRREGFQLQEPKPFEQELTVQRFVLELKPDETASVTVIENLAQEDTFSISDFTADSILAFESQGILNEASKSFLNVVLAAKAELIDLQRSVQGKETELKAIDTDQGRVRGNLRALRSSAEEKDLRKTYLDQLKKDEERLRTLRTELATTRAAADAKSVEIQNLLSNFSLEYEVK